MMKKKLLKIPSPTLNNTTSFCILDGTEFAQQQPADSFAYFPFFIPSRPMKKTRTQKDMKGGE
jgi:hypothetical protein